MPTGGQCLRQVECRPSISKSQWSASEDRKRVNDIIFTRLRTSDGLEMDSVPEIFRPEVELNVRLALRKELLPRPYEHISFAQASRSTGRFPLHGNTPHLLGIKFVPGQRQVHNVLVRKNTLSGHLRSGS